MIETKRNKKEEEEEEEELFLLNSTADTDSFFSLSLARVVLNSDIHGYKANRHSYVVCEKPTGEKT